MRLPWGIRARVHRKPGWVEPAAIWWRKDRLPVIAIEARGRARPHGGEWFDVRTPVGRMRLLHHPRRGWLVTAVPWWLLLPAWLVRPARADRRFELPWRARRADMHR
ncbi:MAG: hypothetical protein GXP39_00370 [Chloroflexi bacterium]|nr:hypothetical protein [Chloroflexota bacterium]